jgi:SAM-dependent methyltransferase
MGSLTEANRRFFDGPPGAVYAWYMERPTVAAVIARAVWGADIAPWYRSMRVLGSLVPGATVIDAPCGAGVALRGLSPAQDVTYLGFDLSDAMLARARAVAVRRGLVGVRFAPGDALALPVNAGAADLFLSYFGLHCFADPAGALVEAARCLRAGGRLVGAMLTRGSSLRHRLLVHPGVGNVGPMGTTTELDAWLRGAGFVDIAIVETGVFAYFESVRP